MPAPVERLVVFAPNWLGDAVMAVPCVEAVRRHYPAAAIGVAARAHLAPLFEMVRAVDEVIPLQQPRRRAAGVAGWLASRDVRRLSDGRFDAAVLLPNSFRAAWIARRARIAERWGYAADLRTPMLTRAVARVRGGHQVEYYQRLLAGLGIDASPASPTVTGHRPASPKPRSGEGGTSDTGLRRPIHLEVPPGAREWSRAALTARGWKAGEAVVGMAPGAAYGTAKQWPPERFGQLAAQLARAGVTTVLVGSGGDRAVCREVERQAMSHVALRTSHPAPRTSHPAPRTSNPVINLAGATDLTQLAAIMAGCRTFVSNDSGAMHLAAAVGVPVVAIFGSTNEQETAPLPILRLRSGLVSDSAYLADLTHAIVATDAWCRPCMLRECPLDHRCMTGIDVDRVQAEVLKRLETADSANESGMTRIP